MSAIYIQHTSDSTLYYGRDTWVRARQRARQFADAHDAIFFCVDRDLKEAQVHVCFGPGAADVMIPITNDMPVAHGSTDDLGAWS